MNALTEKQENILSFVRNYIENNEIAPSFNEISEAFGFASPRSAQKHLQALQRKGMLELVPHTSRGIRLIESSPRHAGDAVRLPLLGRVAAGVPIGADAQISRYIRIDPGLFRPRPDYLLRVEGDSMRDDGILDGDLIAVHRSNDARSGQTVVARLEGEITVKRLELSKNGIRLLPRNPEHQPIVVDKSVVDFAIEGLFVGLIREPS